MCPFLLGCQYQKTRPSHSVQSVYETSNLYTEETGLECQVTSYVVELNFECSRNEFGAGICRQ